MLKHLPRSGMDFLLHIFNLSWSLHSFPSIWKTSSIIPIHEMEKPLYSPAFFRPISSTSWVSKLFERITLSRLPFFLKSNSILTPRQAGFQPGRFTLNQILFHSQSISDGLNKPRPGSRTIRSTIDFSKAFDFREINSREDRPRARPGVLDDLASRPFSQTHFGWPPSLLCSLNSIFPF